MASIADIEQLLEQVFERSTSRLFRTRIQPVQLEHRVERAMERARVGRGSRTDVPWRYRVRVHPSDLDSLAPDPPEAETLAARLADAALVFARAHAYHLSRRPSVALIADPSLQRGRVAVDVDELPSGRQQHPRPPSENGSLSERDGVAASGIAPEREGSTPAPSPSSVPAEPAAAVEPSAQAEPAAAVEPSIPVEPLVSGIRTDGSPTHVYRRPSPEAARAVLRMIDAGGREMSVEVDGRPLTLGRARDNGLVIDDARVSRHHGRLLARHGALVYADLDSTNGSRVNGVRVDEIALGVGDRILVGDTVLVVELLPG